MPPANSGTHNGYMLDPRALNYENSNIDEITLRQLNEDVLAYKHDLNFCTEQLAQVGLTPQETRTLQLRILDLGHQIRHCQHRAEILQIQMRNGSRSWSNQSNSATAAAAGVNAQAGGGSYSAANTPSFPSKRAGAVTPSASGKRQSSSHTASSSAKRAKNQRAPSEFDDDDEHGGGDGDEDDDDGSSLIPADPITNLQRLGHWKCRLCRSEKYLMAGSGRVPSAPCKWPLKDVSKMIAHFTDMHQEHLPAERCVELGAALRRNRGPFEYWLRRSRSQNVGDGSVVDECIVCLLSGRLPDILRRLSRAAAGFPAA